MVLDQLATVEKELKSLSHVLLDDYSVKQRLVGVGVMNRKTAYESGAVGPTARGSGLEMDHRMTGYCAYGELAFQPVVEQDGDCYSRTKVRVRELSQSIDLVRTALDRMPDSELKTPFKGQPGRAKSPFVPNNRAAKSFTI